MSIPEVVDLISLMSEGLHIKIRLAGDLGGLMNEEPHNKIGLIWIGTSRNFAGRCGLSMCEEMIRM